MVGFIKKIFKKEDDEAKDLAYTSPKELKSKVQCVEIPEVVIHKEEGDIATVLIMDDQSSMTKMTIGTLAVLEAEGEIKQCTKIEATTRKAAFSVEKAIEDGTIDKLDFALLDITIGGIINGVELDGIDVAIMIKKRFPECKIKFLTGHSMNREISVIFDYISKFESWFKCKIDTYKEVEGIDGQPMYVYDHIIPKSTDLRRQVMYFCKKG